MTPNDKAQEGVNLLKQAIIETLKIHPEGLRNVDIANILDIRSDFLGANKDYLSWSIIGLLLNENIIERKGRKYFIINK
ncbi:MAG: hypothetical protein LLF92_03935 [Planctomycetaceae bacterium]|nr:hypothetical protein [Planctomycetaceae bacterium]